MSGFNGSGTFNISGTGLPYVSGTTISSSVANTLNNDLATGLSTCITKDGQTIVTNNIPLNNYRITGLGDGQSITDAVALGQVQKSSTSLLTVTGTNTLTATVSPSIAVYPTGALFQFIAANTNTGATTLNISSLGAKNIYKNGTNPLVAGDINAGQSVIVMYDGTQFQLVNTNTYNSQFTINTSGNVGIGTTSTTARLQIAGPDSANIGMGPLGDLTGMGNPRGYYGLNCSYSDSTGLFNLGGDGANNGGSVIWGTVFGQINFSTNATTSGSNRTLTPTNIGNNKRMVIDQNGYVGIYAYDNPYTAQLHVGSGGVAGCFRSPTGNGVLKVIGAGDTYSGGCLLQLGCEGNGTSYNAVLMYGDVNGTPTTSGSITCTATTAAYNSGSDYRLKDNPQPLIGSGAFIDALQPKTWEWKHDGSRGVGFIAHEVQAVSPSSVQGEKDAMNEDGTMKTQTMEYGSAEFIANIIAELQSLRIRVAQLESQGI